MHDYDSFFGGMHLIWWFIWIVFLIWVFLIPTQWGKRNRREEPLDILKRRFARGEISKEQFEEQKKVLESNE
ncbi:SHOCT domain-containing protein [Antarcticibacterium arcticum]|uniref:SHOCT domain-containing protein n=1 Tax=Antarcticibacterium arcticum TaxID=2585771 RepID=A0A5B8YJY5_9FLAO|nr:SHOCT domain-containing protein [Antarcticibacterium arcticum]QED37147.1 SHOCT domain-containing protein [Antarcticibacterium arcticum]